MLPTHAFREAFRARRAAGFLVTLPSSPEGPGAAAVTPAGKLGGVLLVFEQVEQADVEAASHGKEAGCGVRVTVVDQVADVCRRGDNGTPVYAILVDRNGMVAALDTKWILPPLGQLTAPPRPKTPRRRR